MIGRNRRGGFRRRAPAAGVDLEPQFIKDLNPFAWGWMGVGGANATTYQDGGGRDRVQQLNDIGGAGNHWTSTAVPSNAPFCNNFAPLNVSGSWGSYQTTLIPIAVDYIGAFEAFEQFMYQSSSLNATGDFCLFAAFLNTRGGGGRFLFGNNRNNFIRVNQNGDDPDPLGSISIAIAGGTITGLLSSRLIPQGLVVLEVYRTSNVVHVRANGTEVGSNPTISGTFDVSGFGGVDDAGTDGWDDFLLEVGPMWPSLPSLANRDAITAYQLAKWADQS